MAESSPKPRSVLSMDVGRRRIGLAGCDPLGITIIRLPALIRFGFKKDLEVLQALCEKRKVEGLLVGIPLNDKGENTDQGEYCKNYGLRTANALELPLAWVNEHSSSWAASKRFKLRKDKSGQLDSASAALLLEQWLREGPELKPVKMAAHAFDPNEL